MSEKTQKFSERWIVRYRRYSSDEWLEEPFKNKAAATTFRDNYLYDRGPEAQAVIKHFVEVDHV